MAIITGVGTNITDNFVATDDNSFYLIDKGETLEGTSAAAFNFGEADGNTLVVRGTVQSSDYDTILSLIGADGNRIRVGKDGLVTSEYAAVRLQGINNAVVNRGTIEGTGEKGRGIMSEGSNSFINNMGLVSGSTAIGLLSGDPSSDSHTLINSGRILGEGNGVTAWDFLSFTLENTGIIRADVHAVRVDGMHARIENDGTINGGSYGILNSGTGDMTVFNGEDGLIKARMNIPAGMPESGIPTDSAGPIAVWGGSSEDSILNAGLIVGNVYLMGGHDAYHGLGKGRVDGLVYGGTGDDTLIGGKRADEFDGGAGDDWLDGGGGKDKLYGGDGADTIYGGAGRDRIWGGEGDDDLRGGGGHDRIWGGLGDDGLLGGNGNDTLYGEDGNDILHGGDGDDWLDGGDGWDVLSGDEGNDTLYGGAGEDAMFGGDGDDEMHGGDDADEMLGGKGNDTMFGDGGDDWIEGNGGNDVIDGGDGDDMMFGGAGADTIYGGAGDDHVHGDGGNDVIYGGGGNDFLMGDNGNDKLFGGAGADTLMMDAGNDRLTGGGGADVFTFADWNENLGTNRILDFEYGLDKIDLRMFPIADIDDFLDDALSRSGSNAVLDLSYASDTVTGTVVIVDGWGQIDSGDFLWIV